MTTAGGGFHGRSIARVRLKKAPVVVSKHRVPVFHVFEELYVRSLREKELSLGTCGFAERSS